MAVPQNTPRCIRSQHELPPAPRFVGCSLFPVKPCGSGTLTLYNDLADLVFSLHIATAGFAHPSRERRLARSFPFMILFLVVGHRILFAWHAYVTAGFCLLADCCIPATLSSMPFAPSLPATLVYPSAARSLIPPAEPRAGTATTRACSCLVAASS